MPEATSSTNPGGDSVLEARHLVKRLGGRTIVDDVSFTVRAGEVFGFLGPNGAGKTTTIRMITGLARPTSGTVTIGGHDVHRAPELALAHAGAIVETPDLYKFMTGRQNLEQVARVLGRGVAAQIPELARLVALEHRLDERVARYSLGMRQRLGIAQALLGTPRLLVLDEPANGLDPAGIRDIRDLVRRLASERGMAVFVSSHLLAEVETMCDRVAILHRGRVLREAAMAALLGEELPAVVFTASEPERAAAVLSGRFPHAEAIAGADGVRARLAVDEVADANAALVAAGIAVAGINATPPTLEEVFMVLTEGETV